MEKVFIYWDNSNIFHGSQQHARKLEKDEQEGPDASYRVRIYLDNLLSLASADRQIERAVVVGSLPPEMRQFWNRMERMGIKVILIDRGGPDRGEQEMPDRILQLRMLEHAMDYNGDPGIAVLLSGDGAGYQEGFGFHKTLERMHERGWRVELLSWVDSCGQLMQQWVEKNGVFVPLDDFYTAITYLEPSRLAHTPAQSRHAITLDLSQRPT